MAKTREGNTKTGTINQEPDTNKYWTRVGHHLLQERVKKHTHPDDHNGEKTSPSVLCKTSQAKA